MPRELVLLGDWLHTGTLTANTFWRPSAKEGRAELDTDEMAEVVFAEIRAPLNPDGTAQDLGSITFRLDDQDIGQYVRLPGRDDWNLFPPRRYVWASEYVYFGDPLFKALGSQAPIIANTTLKYREKVEPVVQAGATDVTAPFRIRLYGYRYTVKDLPRIMPATAMPGGISLIDRARGRTFNAEKPAIAISRDNWLQLPGGPKQEKPIVMPYWRYARNNNPTQLNLPYEFRFDVTGPNGANVRSADEELYWRFDTEKKALILYGVGVRGHANGGAWWLQMTGDPEQKEHPKGRIPFNDRNNEYHFGRSYPVWGDVSLPPVYYSLRRFADYQALIAGEKAFITFVDNGSGTVPRDGVVFAVNGVLIELREDQPLGLTVS